MNADFPEKLGFLFDPHRYKGARGGRGSGKSWGFARALLILGKSRRMRILCAREIQKSIKQSVHKLLKDQIQVLGLSEFYDVLETEIRGKNGTEFAFTGLASHTVDSIKSYEGVDVCWVEEAQFVSKRSWDILIPTIRKGGSEIWFTFNPELETDETYQRFVSNPPPDCVVVEMNYSDNPWFPRELEAERKHCLLTDPKGYQNIWEGVCKPAVSGAIYFDEIARAESENRITLVPANPILKTHVVMDLGWNDAMSISLVQQHQGALRIIENIEDTHKTLDYYSDELKKRRYNWGQMFLPHDARHRDYKYGKSAEEIMRALGWDVRITPSMSVEDGIRLTRVTFPRLVFHKPLTERLVQCLKRYRRAINQQTNEPGPPLHDEFSHGADNVRYICINADHMSNEDWGRMVPISPHQPDEDGFYF